MKLDMRLGGCLDVLPTLEAGSVQTCITSPPYWALRSYLPEDHKDKSAELGLEPTPELYVAKMVEVFRAVKRVLRDDGTLWLNMGEKMLKKEVLGIPWRVALALQEDGWHLRSEIIWHKPDCMPESCKRRPTKSHEQVFLLTKSASWFYDADAIREPQSEGTHERFGRNPRPSTKRKLSEPGSGIKNNSSFDDAMVTMIQPDLCRNKRSVWTIPTAGYKHAHFAVFPEALVLPCILAGTSEEGCCAGCGAPYVRVTERKQLKRERPNDLTNRHEQGDGVNSCGNTVAGVDVKTIGWECTCSCVSEIDKAVVPCTVLDPFLGSGTTAKVSQQYGRSFVGCELSAEYLELARDRFRQSRLFA